MFMFVQEEMYIRALGLFLGSYITFNLVTQFDNKEEDGDNPTRRKHSRNPNYRYKNTNSNAFGHPLGQSKMRLEAIKERLRLLRK